MGIFSTPAAPYVPPMPAPPPPPPPSPAPDNAAASQAATDAMNRARSAAGYASTILTSPQGVAGPADTSLKTLLGQ